MTLVRLEPVALGLKSSTLPLSHCAPFLLKDYLILFCLVRLKFLVPVNSYGHVETDSSPNHTLSVCTYFSLELTTALLESSEGGE